MNLPIVCICPRSNSFLNRMVPNSIWAQLDTTKYHFRWLGTTPAPDNFTDAQCRSIADVKREIKNCDLLVTTDTGPMHIAAAYGKKIIVIEQACDPDLHLTDQIDYTKISADLECINCHTTCKFNPLDPPCGHINPEIINRAIDQKFQFVNHAISVIVPTMYPENFYLDHWALGYYGETIIGVDGDKQPPVWQHKNVKFVVHKSRQRKGYGKTINHAVRHSTSKYLLLLNDDVIPDDKQITHLFHIFVSRPDCSILGCLSYYPDGSICHGGTHRAPGDIGWGHIDHLSKNPPTIKDTVECENVTFACVLMTRKVFYELRGFDEEYDCYYEDNDFCLRARQRGHKVYYTPHVNYIHAGSKTANLLGIKEQLNEHGKRIFTRKWKWYFDKNRDNQLGTF